MQWDSAVHAWLEDRGPGDLVLVALHDGATGRMLHGRFVGRGEPAGDHRAHRAPRSAVDRVRGPRRTLRPAGEGRRAGEVGDRRWLEAPRVELILAGSPQAKECVERAFGTAQDRLVKEMRVAGVAMLDAANRFLAEHWMPF